MKVQNVCFVEKKIILYPLMHLIINVFKFLLKLSQQNSFSDRLFVSKTCINFQLMCILYLPCKVFINNDQINTHCSIRRTSTF